jgi:hypothetical protein
MADYIKMAPVTLTFQVTLDGVTAGGGVRAVQDSAVVVRASGPNAEFFGVDVNKFGGLYAFDSRKAKGKKVKAEAAAPVAKAPAPVAAKGKAKAKAEPAAPAAAEDDTEMQEYLAFKAFQAMKAKAGK